MLLSLNCGSPRSSLPPSLLYLIFFLGLSWLVWPHFFFRQLTARG